MARFAVDTALDGSAPAWIATLLSLIYSILVLFIRAYFKSGSFGNEDFVLLGAQVVACGQFAAILVALAAGLGNGMSLAQASTPEGTISQALRAGQILYIIALMMSKLSMVLLIFRIFSQLGRATAVCICLGVCVAVWGVAASLASSIVCEVQHLIPGGSESTQCPGSVPRWLAITITDCLSEGAIFVLPSVLCIPLQMSPKRKTKVSFAFAFRLGCIVFSVAHFVAYQRAVDRNGQGKSLSRAAIWQVAGLCYSLVSATIPVSMQFIARFATGASAALGTTTGTYSSGQRRYGRPSGSKSKFSHGSSGKWNVPEIRPDIGNGLGNSTGIHHPSSLHEERMGSQDMFIMRQDDVILVHSR